MARYIIEPGKAWESHEEHCLRVSELFVDAFQGEGIYAGVPAMFLRLAGCPLNCHWCDSRNIWNKSTKIGIQELVDLFKKECLLEKLKEGVHLVITGGSPILQQEELVNFITQLQSELSTKIFIEVETEASIKVESKNSLLFFLVDCWNVSPKLETSEVPDEKRYNLEALEQLKAGTDVWFKFVITHPEKDWEEINERFIKTKIAKKSQIILMPEGATRESLNPEKKRVVAELAVKKGVRYGSRLQIDIYDNKQGV